MILNAVTFLLGLSSIFWLQNLQQAIYLACISFVFLIVLITAKFKRVLISSCWVSIFAGLFWAGLSVGFWLNTTPLLLSTPQTEQIQGYVCSLPVQHHTSSRKSKIKPLSSQSQAKFQTITTRLSFDFCMTDFSKNNMGLLQANKVRLSLYRADQEAIKKIIGGSYWHFTARLKPIHGRLNPGGFDYEKWLLSEGFIGTGYIKSHQPLKITPSLKASYHGWRQHLFQSLNRLVPNGQSKGLILALAIGERSAISAEQWQAVKDSGTSHLLAISGLHIGIAALWSYYFCLFIVTRMSFIIQRIPAQRIAEVGSLLGALSIALISGFGYPAQRALLMLLIFLVSRWSGRYRSLSHLLAFSVIAIVITQPFAVLTVSFWLSILAVSVIVLLLSYRQKINSKHPKFKDWLRINWFLFVGLMPITWFVFDSISVVGFIANLLLIPLTSFVTTPLIYVGLLCLAISDNLALILFKLADLSVQLTYYIQLMLAELNQVASVSSLPIALFVLILLATIILLIPSKLPFKTLVLPIALIMALYFSQTKQHPIFKMVVFDIGQGLAIHIAVGDKNILYDTGYGNGDFSMANSALLPYFKRNGISRLDALILSHSDADHAGGLEDLKRNLLIDKIYQGEATDSTGLNCHETKAWQWKTIDFQFLPHLYNSENNNRLSQPHGNNASCVLQITLPFSTDSDLDSDSGSGSETGTWPGKFTLLLTGDIEKKAEKALVKNGLSKMDLLVAPHHGSLTSSTIGLVNSTQPKQVIFSTGYANQWKFPRQKVLDRYRQIDSDIYITHQVGAITLQLEQNGKIMISTERSSFPHFWHTDPQ